MYILPDKTENSYLIHFNLITDIVTAESATQLTKKKKKKKRKKNSN